MKMAQLALTCTATENLEPNIQYFCARIYIVLKATITFGSPDYHYGSFAILNTLKSVKNICYRASGRASKFLVGGKL